MVANNSDIEKRLWKAADELRANSKLKSSDYSVPVLGLIFLRYADLKFADAHARLSKQTTGRRQISEIDYQAQGVLFIPDKARYENLLNIPEGENIVLTFQVIEQVDEPRAEKLEDTSLQLDLFDARGRQLKGWTNKLIWGDNKLILSSLKNGPLREEIEAQGGIKLIYIDPPFDVGADFSMDVEIWDETFTKKPNILEEIAYRDTWGMGADSFISMIYERLVLMRDLLSNQGSIYVHCDWRVNSYIKLVLDEIFGQNFFRNEIIWQRSSSGKTTSRNFPKDTDTLFWFSKTDDYVLNSVYKPLSSSRIAMYSKDDNDGRGKYRLFPMQKTG